MGYPVDTAAQNACLDAMLGDNASTSMPTSFEFAAFNGHPLFGGTELTSDGGYVRPVVANASANFPDAVDGRKVAAPVPFADPSDAWSDSFIYWGAYDHANPTRLYFVGLLAEELSIVGTETGISIVPEIYWNVEA